jgi:hypothetical protein
MNHPARSILCLCSVGILVVFSQNLVLAQDQQSHTRGKLWETVSNSGWIGDLGSWDYLVGTPLGLYPGFSGYVHPVGGEEYSVDTLVNANMHNFRSGCWIVDRHAVIPGASPGYAPTTVAVETYLTGLQAPSYGVEITRSPLELRTNYAEDPSYNPLLPEEMTLGTVYELDDYKTPSDEVVQHLQAIIDEAFGRQTTAAVK